MRAEKYSREYFLKRCRGHSNFINSKHILLDSRYKYALGLAHSLEYKKVLDIGCGRGEVVFHAAMLGADAIGIDYADAAIDIANDAKKRNFNYLKNCIFQQANAKNLPFNSNIFDYVFMLDIVEHLYDQELHQIFKEVSRTLKDDGMLIIHTAPNEWTHKYGIKFYHMVNPKPSIHNSDVHINIQNVISLKKSLDREFNSKVWLYSPNPYEKTGSYDTEHSYMKYVYFFFRRLWPFKLIFCNDIFAIAWK